MLHLINLLNTNPQIILHHQPRQLNPINQHLIVQLAAPRYKVRQGGWLQVESKDDLKARLGRSTDDADAVLLSLFPVSDVANTQMKHLATDPREAAMMGVDMRGWDDD